MKSLLSLLGEDEIDIVLGEKQAGLVDVPPD